MIRSKTKAELLYLEAWTLLLLINSKLSPNVLNNSDKLIRIQRRAQARNSRRFHSLVKGK